MGEKSSCINTWIFIFTLTVNVCGHFEQKKKKLDSFFYEGKWKHPWQNIIMPSVETYKKDSISWKGGVPEGIPSCHSIEKILRNDGFSTSWFLYLVQN